MIDTITRQIYDFTYTGIFEKLKLMFCFQMTWQHNQEEILELSSKEDDSNAWKIFDGSGSECDSYHIDKG